MIITGTTQPGNPPAGPQEDPGAAKRNLQAPEHPKTKIAHIGRTAFEIPAHMTLAGMVECWKGDSEAFEALAQDIVERHRRFAWQIVSLWARKHNEYLVPRSEFPSEEELRARVNAYQAAQRRKARAVGKKPMASSSQPASSGVPLDSTEEDLLKLIRETEGEVIEEPDYLKLIQETEGEPLEEPDFLDRLDKPAKDDDQEDDQAQE
jgi:hypothetical protein